MSCPTFLGGGDGGPRKVEFLLWKWATEKLEAMEKLEATAF